MRRCSPANFPIPWKSPCRAGSARPSPSPSAVGAGSATAGVVKDAGDDPDVTHGALILATVRPAARSGVTFRAGEGVGTVTRPGLPFRPASRPSTRCRAR